MDLEPDQVVEVMWRRRSRVLYVPAVVIAVTRRRALVRIFGRREVWLTRRRVRAVDVVAAASPAP